MSLAGWASVGLIGLLAVALVLAGVIVWRRYQARQALKARMQELSLLAEVGRAILDAPLDLAGLAEVVYRQASKIVDTNIFQLGLFEADRYRLLIRVVDGVRKPTPSFRLLPESKGIVGWVRESQQSLRVADFEQERATLPAAPSYLSDLPPKSGVFVPLQVGDVVLGVITIQSWRSSAFSEDDVRRLTIIANYAAAALEKGSLLEQARRRADQLQQLADVTQQINAVQPLAGVYRQVVKLAVEKFKASEVSYFVAEGGGLRRAASTGTGAVGQKLALGEEVAGRAAQTRQAVIRQELPDYATADAGDDAGAVPTPQAELAVPVEIDGRLLGVLHAQMPGSVTLDELSVSLFKSLAAQMAITVLEGETYEAEQRRVKQLAALGSVSRAVASLLDADELLDEVLDLLDERFGYRLARVFLRQHDRLVFRAGTGRYAARLVKAGLAYAIDGPGLIALAARSRQPVRVNDVTASPDYIPGPGMEDTQAELAVPLVQGRELLGVIDVQSEHKDAFGAEDQQTLQTLADTLAVALRNARLFEAETRRRRLADMLRSISAALTSTLELDDVLDLILNSLMGVVSYDTASLLLVNEGGELVLRATRGSAQEDLIGLELAVRLIPPGSDLPPIVRLEEVDPDGEYHGMLGVAEPCVSLAALLTLRGEHRGYLVVDRLGTAAFGRAESDLIAAFAAQAVVAIENARLFAAQEEEAWVSTALLQVAEAMVGQSTLAEALATVARLTPLLVGVERVVIYQWDHVARLFRASVVMGLAAAEAQVVRDRSLEGVELALDVDDYETLAATAGASQALPDWLAAAFDAPRGRVWPLHARGDLLGVLLTEDLPSGSRRQSILDGIAHQLAMAMESARLASDLAQQQRLENELEVARGIQASFLPKDCPHAAGWEVGAFWRVARQVGGDFYDFIPLRIGAGEPHWGIVMADVAGKGVPAALFMAMSRTILRSVAINRTSPAATLARVNQLIVTEAGSDLFVSVFYGIWSPQSGRFVYANAGHNAPLWVDSEGQVRPLPGHGVVLGALDDAQYSDAELHLKPREMLLLFTDGLTEAVNATEEEFGNARVREILREAWQADASVVWTLDRLAVAVQAFSSSSGLFDDVTMALLKRASEQAETP